MNDIPVPAVDAATVILVRHGDPVGMPWQVFMVRRHVRSDFAADVYVFPGGKVDPADRESEVGRFLEMHRGPQSVPEGDDATARALRLAAIRELFEEAGILLARGSNGASIHDREDIVEQLARWRQGLQGGTVTMLDLARSGHLSFSGDRMHPFSRWITPEVLPRRYDTWFYVAYLPAGQQPLHDAMETTDGVWVSPKEALERNRMGTFPLVFATEKQLERMSHYASVEQMIASTSATDLRAVMPRIVESGGKRLFLLPGDEGY